ncbi:hemolysin family protein [Kiritimatiella glycovorans]|uniref:Magnesium and cobalt efflux protein CorC n=1 Tax=Kiritimatiella glycovorans TaxID=1307763 RepID=A0A0G3ELM7_9BACT|nr:hemolysin family protein [Kiritimatiella glycovorans]AKJ65695.1 Magnesium and cobalt efflux protein CorC [Kiritimatiella glycovorans]
MEQLSEYGTGLAGLVLLLAGSAFFSGAETALFSLKRDQLHQLARSEGRTAAAIVSLSSRPAELLVAVLFGNMLVNLLFFCSGAAMATHLGRAAGGWIEVAAGIVLLVLVILFGEILPKALGVSYPLAFSRAAAIPLRGWFALTSPVRAVYRAVRARRGGHEGGEATRMITGEELRILLDLTRGSDSVPVKEKEIIEDIVHLPGIRISEIMTPRVDVLLLDRRGDPGPVLEAARRRDISTLPVYEDHEDRIIGIVGVRDLYFARRDGRDGVGRVRPVKFVPEMLRADELLRRFVEENLEFVVVVDEYGGLAGVVTIEDLLEEVLGEFDAGQALDVDTLGEARYRLSGRLPVREWRALFRGYVPEAELESLPFDTLAGLIVYLLGRVPREGDTVRLQNLAFTVERMHGRRIETVLLELASPEEELKVPLP